jgi:hypothetical protein
MSSCPRHAGGFAPDARQALDELLKEWGLALTKALFVANSELWERYKALPSGDALTLAFAPKAQALAEISWEYAWDLAAKTPLARRLLGQHFQPPEFHLLSFLLFLFRCLPGKIVAHRHA